MNDCGNGIPNCLSSESGVFHLDKEGVAREFAASEGNPLVDERRGSLKLLFGERSAVCVG